MSKDVEKRCECVKKPLSYLKIIKNGQTFNVFPSVEFGLQTKVHITPVRSDREERRPISICQCTVVERISSLWNFISLCNGIIIIVVRDLNKMVESEEILCVHFHDK